MQSRTVACCAALAVPVLVLAGAVVLAQGGDEVSTASVEPQALPLPLPLPAPVPKPQVKAKPPCTTAKQAFVPTSMSIPGVDTTISVLALPRDLDNVPGITPLTASGKLSMALDLGSGILPGAKQGNALLNAHTYPNGTALGNKLLAKLDRGDPIVLRGPGGRLCYTVNDREEVPELDRGLRYFAKTGKPQIAILVCSGKRLGPGQWTKRTIWYASPTA